MPSVSRCCTRSRRATCTSRRRAGGEARLSTLVTGKVIPGAAANTSAIGQGNGRTSSGGSAMRPKHSMWKGAAVLVAAVVIAACGARVDDTQVSAAGGGARTSGGASAAAQDQGVQPGEATAVGAAGTAASGSGTTGSGATGGPSTSVAATAPGDNGGATDVGVTATQISLGNISTLSGPVPGLFAGAVYGTQAWVAYQNSLGGINGRKIRLDVRDDQFDTGQNRAQTDEAIAKDFSLVGSFSLYDDAAIPEIEKAGVADLHIPLASAAQTSPNNFAVNPVKRGTPTGPWNL